MSGPWKPPEDWRRVTTIDVHAAGEPLRIIVAGFPIPPGDTILSQRDHARRHCDALRRTMMWEPRGHADMYGCLLMPPATPDGDIGVLFMHNEGFSTMCGHGIIGLVKAGLDCGLLPRKEILNIDTPAGRVVARAQMGEGGVSSVTFRNVPSFVCGRAGEVAVDGFGAVPCVLAFGGAFYAYVDADAVGLELTAANARALIDLGMAIKRAVVRDLEISHPDGDPDLEFLYGTIFFKPLSEGAHSRNVCVFADGELDRSPTGTGVSGRAAIEHARGALRLGESITIESILGTTFDVRVVETTTVGGTDAIVPEVTGTAYITGRHEFLVDPDDPLRDGFRLG